MQVVGGGRRRLGALRGGKVLVGAGRLAGRPALYIQCGFQALRALRLLRPKRFELIAGLVALGCTLRTAGVLLLDPVPARLCRPCRLLQQRAPPRVVCGLLRGGRGAFRQALGFRALRRCSLDGSAERSGRFLTGGREFAEASQGRQGCRDLLARGAVVARDARQLILQVRLPLLQGRVLLAELSLDRRDGRQPTNGPFHIHGTEPFDDPGCRLLRLLRSEHLLAGRGRRAFVLGCRSCVPARLGEGLLELLQVRRWILRVLLGSLFQTNPQLLDLLAGLAGQFSRLLQLVGAPYLPQDAASFARFVFHQQASETPLRQDDGTQKRIAVESD